MKQIRSVLCKTAAACLVAATVMAQDSDTLVSKASSQNPHGQIPIACDACHSTGQWNTVPAVMAFDHNAETGFPLDGLHKSANCKACHTTLTFKISKNECYQCHSDIHKGQLGNDCQKCHSPANWQPREFNHAMTRFPLIGRHATTDCQSCHQNQKENEFAGLSTSCGTCHAATYQNAKNPDHVANGMGTDCEFCHTPLSWNTLTIRDHTSFGFALTMAHAGQACESCHAGREFAKTNRECYSCHQSDFESTSDPDHVGRQFSNQCADCHTAMPGWKPALFDHAGSAFPMTGAHMTAQDQCASCHASTYINTPTDCYACHRDDYTATDDPNHVTANLSTACADCHTTNPDWKPALFDHSQTGFSMTGGHLAVENQCVSCHASGYNNTPTDCYACHQSDFTTAADPNHVANSFSTTCTNCHTTSPDWTPAAFDHSVTLFQMTGAHLTVQNQCVSCHASGFNNTSTDCYACHQANYEATTDPNHITSGFSTHCDHCHTTNPGWTPAVFSHDNTSFPLTGAHLIIQNQCVSCHPSGYANTPTDCYACHQADYTAAVDPNHVTNSFSTTCTNCHTTNPGWSPATFDHSGTSFPLTGAHVTVQNQCASCHASGYTNTPTDCYACHQADYTAAVDPNHVSNNFSTTCTNCHTTNPGWSPATFDHSGTSFPMTGAHVTVQSQCVLCHASGYTNTPTDCYACHQADYTAALNPNHPGLTFPTACQGCHATSGWVPSTFNHAAYTGYALQGAHTAIANQCSQCHTGNLTSASSDCYSCHQSDYNGVTNPNHVTNNFPHDCLMCHTQNVWDPSTLNHDAQYFPIYTGRHAGEWTGCGGGSGSGAGCHTVNTNYQLFSCIHCHEHRQSEMDIEHEDVTGYSYNSEACFACHPDGSGLKVRIKNFKID